MDSEFISRLKNNRKRDEEMRKKYPNYPPPDELDELDNLAIDGKITEDQYYELLNDHLTIITDWFKNIAPKKIDGVFKNYI